MFPPQSAVQRMANAQDRGEWVAATTALWAEVVASHSTTVRVHPESPVADLVGPDESPRATALAEFRILIRDQFVDDNPIGMIDRLTDAANRSIWELARQAEIEWEGEG